MCIILLFSQKVLNPPIPEEILVNFHVNCDKLVFDVFLLNVLTTNTPNQVNSMNVNDNNKSKVPSKKLYVVLGRIVYEDVLLVRVLLIRLRAAQGSKVTKNFYLTGSTFHTPATRSRWPSSSLPLPPVKADDC